jgi:hypothetical protein
MHYILKNALDAEVIHMKGFQHNVDYTIFYNEHCCVYFKGR